MTIKIEFPSDRKDIAKAFANALYALAEGEGLPEVHTPGEVADCDFVSAHTEQASDLERIVTDAQEKAAEIMQDAADSADGFVHDEVFTSSEGAFNQAEEPPTVDSKGVEFNAQFCGKAKDPFYGSGTRVGQWKKRKGVSDDDYDAWYAGELLADQVETVEEEPEMPTEELQKAFCGQPTSPALDAPKNAGELMKWASEQQAAGHLTPEQVNGAYSTLGMPMDAIFNPQYDVEANCLAIHNHLKGLLNG